MATCSFIKERKQTAGSMGRVIQYVSQPKKTVDEEGNRYLTGVNCVADVAMQSFMATKWLYGKDNGTFFYQYTQSFSPEENLTPAQAHEIGLELAEQRPDLYETWPINLEAIPAGSSNQGVEGRGIPGCHAGRELEIPTHHHRGGSHAASWQPGSIHTGDEPAGLSGTMGGKSKAHHLHHTLWHEVQRR